MAIIFEDDLFETFNKFERSANLKRSVDFQNYVDKLIPNVLQPLKMLINMFSGPLKLIDKRLDKLLDYEGALSELELKQTNDVSSNCKEVLNLLV